MKICHRLSSLSPIDRSTTVGIIWYSKRRTSDVQQDVSDAQSRKTFELAVSLRSACLTPVKPDFRRFNVFKVHTRRVHKHNDDDDAYHERVPTYRPSQCTTHIRATQHSSTLSTMGLEQETTRFRRTRATVGLGEPDRSFQTAVAISFPRRLAVLYRQVPYHQDPRH